MLNDSVKRAKSLIGPLLFAAALLPVVFTIAAIAYGGIPPDFASFYESGRAWLNGAPPYPGSSEFPNMNPPSAVVLLFAPLAHLNSTLASLIWCGVGVIGVAASGRLIARELGSLRDGALLALSVPAGLSWIEGQITWLLLYPITRAWIAYRNRQPLMSGLWLGPVIAVKPFLALLPLSLGFIALLVSGLCSAGISSVVIAWTHWPVWRTWIDTAAAVPFVGYLNNASLWAPAARAVRAHTVAQVGWLASVLILTSGAVMLVLTYRDEDPDRRWLAGGLFALLLSPLGWIYYAPLFVGPLLAVLRDGSRSRLIRGSLTGFAIPTFALGSWRMVSYPAVLLTLASIYTWSVLTMWLCLAVRSTTSNRAAAQH